MHLHFNLLLEPEELDEEESDEEESDEEESDEEESSSSLSPVSVQSMDGKQSGCCNKPAENITQFNENLYLHKKKKTKKKLIIFKCTGI